MAKKSQAQIEFKAVTSEFTSGIKEVNSSLKTMQNELKLNSAQLKNTGEDSDLLSQRQQILQKQYDATTQKIELTQNSLEEARKILGENSTEYKNLENALLRAKIAQENIQTEINRTSQRLENLESSANGAENNIESLTNEFDRLENSTNSFDNSIEEINTSLKTMQNELKLNSEKLKDNSEDTSLLSERQQILQRQYAATTQKIELTEKALEDTKRTLGENSDEYKKLSNSLLENKISQQNIQNELSNTNTKLKDSSNGFTTLKGAIATFAGNVLTSAISKISSLAGELFNLNEETKEFRMNMAKLDGATTQYGYSTDYINQKIKEMYGYFGDEQVAVNTISNLQGLKLTQDELSNTLNASIAVWTAYGDSIPIEGLTESINETAQVGEITGSLADALNWAGISEDTFNEKLGKCNSTKKRAKLITDTLKNAYDKSKQTYDKNTESLRKNNEANMDLIQAQSELGETIEPVKTALTNLKTEILEGITPAIQIASDKTIELINWFKNLPSSTQETILAVVGVTTGIIALIGAAGIISTIWSVVTGIFSAGIGVFVGAAGAIAGLSAPVLIAVAVIGSLIAIGVALYKNLDTVKAKVAEFKTQVVNKFTELKTESINKFSELKTSAINKFNDLKTQTINKATEMVSPIVNKFNSIKTSISNAINTAKDNVKNAVDKIKGFFNFTWSLPKLKLPHFSMTGKFSLNPPSVPKIGVEWYAKGGIMTSPTVFGMNGNRAMVGGEAGPEAILPISILRSYIRDEMEDIIGSNSIDYTRMTQSFMTALKELDFTINMDSREVARGIAKHKSEIDNYDSRNPRFSY